MDSRIASCAKKFSECVAGIISLAVENIYYIQNYRCVYHNHIPDSDVFFEIYRIWFTSILNLLHRAAQQCKPTGSFTCARQDILRTSYKRERKCMQVATHENHISLPVSMWRPNKWANSYTVFWTAGTSVTGWDYTTAETKTLLYKITVNSLLHFNTKPLSLPFACMRLQVWRWC